MSELVTIVVSAGGASEQLLRTCLCSLERHKNATDSRILLVCPEHQAAVPISVGMSMGVDVKWFEADDSDKAGSGLHGFVLDQVIPHINTEFLLTLDADCFPMRERWLDELMVMTKKKGAAVAGILHPYAPPPDDMPKTGIEWRIRSQLCWDNTHVACQLIRFDILTRLKVGFADGDDTGLAIPMEARKVGLQVMGWKPTACGMPEPSYQGDPEFNRENCVVFEDWMYHHGGGSREVQGRGSPNDAWRLIRNEVLQMGGAESLLGPLVAYRYSFDREEEVATAMVRRIMGGMSIYLQDHDRLFKS